MPIPGARCTVRPPRSVRRGRYVTSERVAMRGRTNRRLLRRGGRRSVPRRGRRSVRRCLRRRRCRRSVMSRRRPRRRRGRRRVRRCRSRRRGLRWRPFRVRHRHPSPASKPDSSAAHRGPTPSPNARSAAPRARTPNVPATRRASTTRAAGRRTAMGTIPRSGCRDTTNGANRWPSTWHRSRRRKGREAAEVAAKTTMPRGNRCAYRQK
mmetsp:Transcript_23667/g.51091  ORF Transcript_23667/g.51091 Transcript_23667/m.51091 type:complete len:209 (+) Transcript_23667:620-1246(+)